MAMIDKRPPFEQRDSLPVAVPEKWHDCFFSVNLAFRFVSWILLLEQRFGPELARITSENLRIQADRFKDGGEEGEQVGLLIDVVKRLYAAVHIILKIHEREVRENGPLPVPLREKGLSAADIPFEWRLAMYILYTFPESPLVQEHGSLTKEGGAPAIPDEMDFRLMDLLIKAREEAVEAFAHVVSQMDFVPESVAGLSLRKDGE